MTAATMVISKRPFVMPTNPLWTLQVLLLLLGGRANGQDLTTIQNLMDNESTIRQHQERVLQKRHYRFAVIPKQSGLEFYESVHDGCDEKARQLTTEFSRQDVDFDHRYPQEGATVECLFVGPDPGQSQAELVERLLWGDDDNTIDGLAISVQNAQAMAPIIDRAVTERNLTVLTFDSDARNSMRRYYIGTNNTFLGTQLARGMETLRPSGGTFGIIANSDPNIQERVQGILEELNHKSNPHHQWKLLEEPYDAGDDMTKIFDKMEQWADLNPAALVSTKGRAMQISYDPQTNTSYSLWKDFVDRHRHRKIALFCADAMPHQLEMLQEAYVDGLVGQLPYDMGVKVIQTLWTLTFEPDAQLGDPEEDDDDEFGVGGEATAFTDRIETNVLSHVHIPLRLPPVHVNNNLIGNLRYLGFTLYGIVATTAIGFAAWAYFRRNVRVVRVAQPRFLIMIATGTLILGASMIPLGMDDGGGTRADCFDSHDSVDDYCKAICTSVPWLSSMGFTITFSALYSKTRRVNKIFKSNTAFGKVQVSEMDVLVPFFVLLAINAVILTLWTILDPLTYVREADFSRDGWNRVISTYGVCRSDSRAYFLIPLAIVDTGVLLLANWQAYEARDIESEFAETKYIGICMASLLQAVVSGVPVLFVVKDRPQAYYIVGVLFYFIVCMVVLLVMFVPKIVYAQQYMAMSPAEQKQYMSGLIQKSAKSTNSHRDYSSNNSTTPKPSNRFSSLSVKPFGTTSGRADMTNSNILVRPENESENTKNDGDVVEDDGRGFFYFRKSIPSSLSDGFSVDQANQDPLGARESEQTFVSARTTIQKDVIMEGDEENEDHPSKLVKPAVPMEDPEHPTSEELVAAKD